MENRMQNVKLVKPMVVGTYAFLLSQQEKRKYGNMTHKWTCLLRCPNSSDLSLFVTKVVFELDPSFIYPKRVYTQPPYEVNEIGWGEFYLTVKVYFDDTSLSPISITHFVKLNTDSENEHPPCVVNETYEEIIFRNPTIRLYNKIVQSNSTKTAPHKFQEHFLKYDFKEDNYTKKYLQFQSKVQEEICDLMSEATMLSKEINETQQKYFSMKAEIGVSSDEN
ncbi:YEATS domain-containing protein, putative [Plasmodium chabaudi chabaudi]|uniref:YEATS domain-containing protein, putative n=5 Tax=Plasmodium (Vinckeia) TaxID=418101 RepID=A0A4V0KBL6_PLACU|nr:YEATS domain-containing protein, putative [Plasmodium chabaudi chabaudi]VTZ69714.1 YEATS domain-containing protein, putative [Plasmodium chabaudi chabaudi]|eukprot:XP_016654267.1 gas41 homologue, putative [Plasmodium chabaudi chabaudi]